MPLASIKVALLLALALPTYLSDSAFAQPKSEPSTVVVSIQPQAYFVERIGGDYVDVSVLVGPGRSPATYEPTPQQMVELQQADFYFSIGVPFEAALLPKIRALRDDLIMVDMLTGQEPAVHDDDQVKRHAGHEHDHSDLDPHVWMNPELVKQMAGVVCDKLSQHHVNHAADFEHNLQEFCTDLDSLQQYIRERLTGLEGGTFFVFHPAYGHFAEAFDLVQVAVEVGGKEPSARQTAAFIDRARREGVRTIVVQPQFASKSAETIAAAIGGRVVALDPLARDYLANMREIAEKLAHALEGDPNEKED